MELLASSYYAQLGMGGVARPMVVGDRLFLFSQTPNGPMQPLVMQNRPGLASQAAAAQQLLSGRPAYYNRHLINTVPRLPISAYSRGAGGPGGVFNPHLSPFDARTHPLGTHHPMNSNSSSINKEDYLNYQAKFMPHLGTTPPPLATSSGLADLEKAFGNRSDLMGLNRVGFSSERVSTSIGVDRGGDSMMHASDVHKDSDTESEIDCEQVDE